LAFIPALRCATPPPPTPTLFPYTTLFRSRVRIHADKRVRGSGDEARKVMAELKIEVAPSGGGLHVVTHYPKRGDGFFDWMLGSQDRKSTRLNSSHQIISYAVFCLKKKNTN